MNESTTTRQRKLVVVDDDELGRRMIKRALSRRGFVVSEATDGRSGLELVRSELPDAVLLDLRMPGGMSGIDVLRELREHTATSSIPVIMVTASVHSDVKKLVGEIGAAGFVEKPVDFAQLEQVLASALGDGGGSGG